MIERYSFLVVYRKEMQKVSVYRGIEYIRISELPEDEKSQIRNWLNRDLIIKIQTQDELLPDCVVYKEYVHWFKNIYTQLSPADTQKETSKADVKSKPYSGLAFD